MGICLLVSARAPFIKDRFATIVILRKLSLFSIHLVLCDPVPVQKLYLQAYVGQTGTVAAAAVVYVGKVEDKGLVEDLRVKLGKSI